MVNEIVIWAHSECRSTMSLFREVKRQAGVPVAIALWKYGECDDIRKSREATGQCAGEYADLGLVPIGEDFGKGRAFLAKHSGEGIVHVFCVYQVSSVWRQLIKEAKEGGAKVVVYAEAPCEMCLGAKAWLKRLYYRFILPVRVGWVVKYADLFLCQSGEVGIVRLLRIGWEKARIVPFGYVSPPLISHTEEIGDKGRRERMGDALRILHTGVETDCRDIATLLKAVRILKKAGVVVELVRTHGGVPLYELKRLCKWADVFVACGRCEPWGMRVNDAIHAGLPVIVSDGMGAKMIVVQYGCGIVYRAGDARALSDVLCRFAKDSAHAANCLMGVAAAHEAWLPAIKARTFIKLISS